MAILIFILAISLLVIVHELGHFLVACWRGVRVEEFGFGYPPKLIKLFTWRGTKFTLNAIPFGGFVRMKGEDYDPSRLPAPQHAPSDAFYAKSAPSRLAVILAGPIANILFGMLAFSVVFGVVGIPKFLEDRPRIEAVAPGSPAEQAGIAADYEIVGFRLFDDFVETNTIDEVVDFVKVNQGREVTVLMVGPCVGFSCPEISTEKQLYLRPEAETPDKEGSMGVIFSDFFFEKGPWYKQIINGIAYGVQEALALGVIIVIAVADLFRDLLTSGTIPTGVAGPVGIVHQASRSNLLTRGWAPLAEFTGMLSINLGVMNLLPIPALDGGRVLFILLEKIVGKKRIQNIEGYVHYGGFLLLLSLIVLISFRDVVNIFQS
jgi:regulator of sigma E protease